jgi:hypothetical protein
MPPILVLIIVGVLLAIIGYLSLQLYIQKRILRAFERAAVVVPAQPESTSGLKSGLVMLGLVMLAGLFFSLVVR